MLLSEHLRGGAEENREVLVSMAIPCRESLELLPCSRTLFTRRVAFV